jgi:long-subunit acyl-CoA synthetase (AMP-forming)
VCNQSIGATVYSTSIISLDIISTIIPDLATNKLLRYLLDHTGTKTIFTQDRENIYPRLGVLPWRKNHNEKHKNYISILEKDEIKTTFFSKGTNVALRKKAPYKILKSKTQNTMGGGKQCFPPPRQTRLFSLVSLSKITAIEQ